jgi:methylthioribose-1-phosphate isomerase
MKLESLAIRYDEGQLWILDQQALPHDEIWLECQCIADMCAYIHALKVRGAPLIGIAAVLALAQYVTQGANIDAVKQAMKTLVATRPTAVNLRNYMQTIETYLGSDPSIVLSMAESLFNEDVQLCNKMAQFGSEVFPENATVMTYCNTGSLATVGCGTALGVIKKAYEQGKIKQVFPCETRPLLQGARLTAWELAKAKIPYTLICDNMAASVMQQQKISAILVGADRIAANGDTANKIGTYSLAILAKYHQVPFYVVAPYTTLDKTCASGNEIVIEQRDKEEVLGALGKINWAPHGTNVFNPSFDVTPASLITGYILDSGVVTKI